MVGTMTSSSFFDADGVQSQVQRRGSGIHRHRVAAAQIAREVFLETLDLGTGREPSGSERLNDRLDLVFADGGLVKRNEFVVVGFCAVSSKL